MLQQRLDERAGARVEAPALHVGERVADELLDARERATELLEVVLDQRGQQRREHELRDLRRALGRRHELPERLLLGGPGQPRLGPGDDEHDAPLIGHRVVRQQRRRALDVAPHPALDHEAPERERPRAHGGARRAADRLGQLRRVDRAIVERRQRLRHRERELRARPQPDVRRDRLDHAQVRAAREAERILAAAREAQRPVRVGALGGQLVGRPRLDDDGGPIDRHPEPAEAPRTVAGHGEHPEVQARRRLDAHHGHLSPAAVRRWSVT